MLMEFKVLVVVHECVWNYASMGGRFYMQNPQICIKKSIQQSSNRHIWLWQYDTPYLENPSLFTKCQLSSGLHGPILLNRNRKK